MIDLLKLIKIEIVWLTRRTHFAKRCTTWTTIRSSTAWKRSTSLRPTGTPGIATLTSEEEKMCKSLKTAAFGVIKVQSKKKTYRQLCQLKQLRMK
jgi:hypothetical protein